MTRSIIHASRRFRRFALVGVLAGLGAVEVGTKYIVKTDVNVKTATNPFAAPVETVPSDTVLEVLVKLTGADSGWLRVRAPDGEEGFISESDLPPRADLAAVQGSGGASQLASDAALRGLQDDATHYGKSKNYNIAAVLHMLELGQSITDNDLISFGKAGHIGPKNFRQ